MTTIKIKAEDELVAALRQIAKSKATTVEALVNDALLKYLQLESPEIKSYSFIGIGHSGKGNISTQVEETLEKAANKREGWSLSQ
jgi:predicted transcriptional regulator